MKNILIVSELFLNGGLETHILAYANELKKMGHRVFLASISEKSPDISYDDFEKVYTLQNIENSSNKEFLLQVDELSKIVENENINIIHAHPFFSIILLFFVSQKYRIPLFVTLHGPISVNYSISKIYDLFLKTLLVNYAQIIVVSKETQALLFPYYNDITILPNAVDTDKFLPVSMKHNIEQKCALVSRLDEDKMTGILEFIEMAIETGIKEIVIFGSGQKEEDIKSQVNTLSKNIQITFHGFSSSLDQKLQDGFTLVAGMGRVVLEASAMNLPVILVGYDGIKGLIDEETFMKASEANFSGRNLPNITSEELRQQFREYKNSPEVYHLRDIVQKSFSMKNVIQIYHKLLDNTQFIKYDDYKDLYMLFFERDIYEKWISNEKLITDMISLLHKNSKTAKNVIYLKVDELKKDVQVLTSKIEQQNSLLTEQEQLIRNQSNLIRQKDEKLEQLRNELNTIYNSNLWKVAQKYYALKEKPFMVPFVKLAGSLKRYGLVTTVKKFQNRSSSFYRKLQDDKKHREDLDTILSSYSTEIIVILPPLVDWNIPLFQRPQHLAKNLAKQGFLYFYCTKNTQYDQVNGFEVKCDRCYVTNRFDLVDSIENRKKVYDLSSTDNNADWNFVLERLNRGDTILYQYIDEISAEISGAHIPKSTMEKHFNILKDERCIVIPSATKLEEDVKKYRKKNYKLVTNGVELEHFSQKIDYQNYSDIVKRIVDKKKPIIGYFGAFASWFDYELVIKLAKEREEFELLLLGVDYDGSIKKYGLDKIDNITIAGPIDYKELPNFSACFSVSTIPFIINDITESTSPIKLFEYMAMGKPIVTTDMPECRKYESVLIGKTHDDFIAKIDKALRLSEDKNYLKTLQQEANENSWEAKAKDIAELIRENL